MSARLVADEITMMTEFSRRLHCEDRTSESVLTASDDCDEVLDVLHAQRPVAFLAVHMHKQAIVV